MENPYIPSSTAPTDPVSTRSWRRLSAIAAICLGPPVLLLIAGGLYWSTSDFRRELGTAIGDALTSPEFESEMQRAVVGPAVIELMISILDWVQKAWTSFGLAATM